MADVTAAAMPVVLEGVEYWMTPLDDRDIEELNNWLRSTVISMARQSLTPSMTRAEREEILDSAMRTARRMSWMSEDARSVMSTIDGVTRVMWQGMRKRHPNLRHEDLRAALLRDENNILALNKIFKEINTGAALDTEETQPGKKSRRPRGRKSTRG